MNVMINGIRYVPASEAVVGLDDLREALEDLFWGKGYNPRPESPGYRSEGLFVRVFDDSEGQPLNDFMDQIAANLADKDANNDG